MTPAGSVSVACVAKGSGVANDTSPIVADFSSSLEKVGAIAWPSGSVMRIARAWLNAIGAEKTTCAFSTGLHPAAALTRLHSKRAVKGLRTV